MKITKVTPVVIKVPKEDSFGGVGVENKKKLAARFDYAQQTGWRGLYSRQTESTLVKIETDEGIIGYGEGQAPLGPEVTASVIEKLLKPILIGKDPTRVGILYHEMYEAMNLRGHYTGFMVHGIAAVDIALWDIWGKKLNVPVADLLGGRFRDRVPVYVSGVRGKSIEEKVKSAKQAIDHGHQAIKMFLGFGLKEDLAQVSAIREAVGSDVTLMVDVLWNYDVPTAIKLGRGLEHLGVYWFETPTSPEDIEGHAEIARTLDMAVAAGEAETTCYQFIRWFQARALDIAQPDVGRCGITETKNIASLAGTFNIPVALHSGICFPPSIAASIHAASTIPNLIYQEYQPMMLELSNQFLKHPIKCKSGYFELPEGPGLGIEMDEHALSEYIK